MGYGNRSAGDMSVEVKDYQPGEKEFAGAMKDTANTYIPRTEKRMAKDAGQVKKQAYQGRYA
jgi:hypothetical protein